MDTTPPRKSAKDFKATLPDGLTNRQKKEAYSEYSLTCGDGETGLPALMAADAFKSLLPAKWTQRQKGLVYGAYASLYSRAEPQTKKKVIRQKKRTMRLTKPWVHFVQGGAPGLGKRA